jgi:tetratricopeptide (TPR) repeat protein
MKANATTSRTSTGNRHAGSILWMSVLAGVVLGCHTERASAPPASPNAPASAAVAAPHHASTTNTAQPVIPAPPGVDVNALAVPRGEAAARSRLDLPRVLASLNQPAWLHADPAAAPPGEPPLMAQRAFATARLAYREQQLDEALRQLHLANSLAPRRPEVLRMLGHIYQRRANTIRAAHFLEQVVALQPDDLDTILALGRFAMLQRHWEHSIAIFARAMELLQQHEESLRPASMILVRYHLATALEQAGYDLAAVQEFQSMLSDANWHDAEARHDPQMLLLARQRGLLWQQVGDAWHRLAQPASAIDAYNRAQAAGIDPGAELVARMVYTLLILGRTDAVKDLLVDALRHAAIRENSLQLISYAHEHGLNRHSLVEHLSNVYQNEPSPQLAIVMADMLDAPQSRALLINHLAGHPADQQVLARLLQIAFTSPAGEEPAAALDPLATGQIILAIAGAIADDPQIAQPYAAMLAEVRVAPTAMLAIIDGLPAVQRQDPSVRYIRAVLLVHARDLAAARGELLAVVDQRPNLLAARLQLAAILVHQGEHAQADRLLAAIADSTDPGVVHLRVRILTETGQLEQALAMLDDLMARHPDQTDWAIEKHNVQMRMNDLAGAERTLWDAVNLRPEDERLYAVLFQFYDRAQLSDGHQQYIRLMRKLQATIPHSRLARLKMIEFTRDAGEKATLLHTLWQEDPTDVQVLSLLLQTMVESNRRDEADQLLRGRLQQDADNPELLRVAFEHYERVRDRQQAMEVLERLLHLQAPTAERDANLALVLMQSARHEQAVELLEAALKREVTGTRELRMLASRIASLDDLQAGDRLFHLAVARFPHHEADLRYFHAMLYNRHRQIDQSLKMLADLIARFPDHPEGNNHLGYSWAVQGINLPQAKQMIQVALDDDPNSAAYIDSMGWVLYKMGDFPEAVRRLRQAEAAAGQPGHPVILDHLGDALYRSGDTVQARQAWLRAERALSSMSKEEVASDSDMDGLAERLRAKLQALAMGNPPPVADIVPAAEPQP